MTKINELDITQDGTFLLSEVDGKAYPVELHSGYMVGVKSLNGTDEAPTGLFGRWTNYLEDVPNGPGEFDYDTVDVVYWDEVELVNDKSEAIALAEMYGELAIWDNANNEEIRV